MRTDRLTEIERSLYFLIATIPVIKAIILTGNITATVTSHQRLSKESILNISTETREVVIITKKNVLSPTDHLPNLVFGIKDILICLLYQKTSTYVPVTRVPYGI